MPLTVNLDVLALICSRLPPEDLVSLLWADKRLATQWARWGPFTRKKVTFYEDSTSHYICHAYSVYKCTELSYTYIEGRCIVGGDRVHTVEGYCSVVPLPHPTLTVYMYLLNGRITRSLVLHNNVPMHVAMPPCNNDSHSRFMWGLGQCHVVDHPYHHKVVRGGPYVSHSASKILTLVSGIWGTIKDNSRPTDSHVLALMLST